MKVLALIKPFRYRHSGIREVVVFVVHVMAREQVMIQKDRVEGTFRKPDLRLFHCLRHDQIVPGKTLLEPFVPTFVII